MALPLPTQCYDKFMLAGLKACADQVSQPSWGLGGPHDAGSYCIWPHQTGFFHQHGSWNTPYGKFFMQARRAGCVDRKLLWACLSYMGLSYPTALGVRKHWFTRLHTRALPLCVFQWYSEMLARHADDVLSAARGVFDGCPLQLSVRIPGNHWWYNTASHAPEMTAG